MSTLNHLPEKNKHRKYCTITQYQQQKGYNKVPQQMVIQDAENVDHEAARHENVA